MRSQKRRAPRAKIDPDAVWNYLNRRYDDHRWMKDLAAEEVEEFLDDMDPRPEFKFVFDLHQKVCFILCIAYLEMYLHLEMGVGKTRIIFAVFDYLWRQVGKIIRGLVVVPSDTNVDEWFNQLQDEAPWIPCATLKGSGNEKWEAVERFEEGLAIISYPGLVRLCCETQKVRKRGQKKARNQMVPIKSNVDWIGGNFDILVMDEITKSGNHDSLTFRILDRLGKLIDIRFGLAGRMFGRDPMLVWSQFHCIDRGATFGDHIGLFREVYFDAKESFFGGPFAMEYKFRDDMEDTFNRIQQHRSIRYTTDEAGIVLPPVTARTAYVDLPPSSLPYYQNVLADLKASRGNIREVQNNFLRLRQIASGFVGFYDDDEGEKAEIEFAINPKLDMLMSLIDQMREDRKFIISVDFTWSGRKISQALEKAKIKAGWLYGGTKDWAAMKRAFDKDPKFRGIVVQNRKAAYGLNLQSANYLFIFESPVPVIDRDQLEKRLARRGQQLPVFQWDLVMRHTADETILKYHRKGGNLFKMLVQDPSKVLGNGVRLDNVSSRSPHRNNKARSHTR